MGRDKLSFKPTIASPCEESWTAMEGGSRERHCQLCDRHVHNFAAMTSREIERLVREADGKLCARITRRGDGSLVTLDGGPRASVAAQVVASASLAMSAAGAFAQNPGEQPKQAEAVLTGTVLKPDGSGPFEGAFITLVASGSQPVLFKSDEQGHFRASVALGIYEIRISQNFYLPARINGVQLHEGEQSLQPIRVPEKIIDTVTMGTFAVETSHTYYTLSGAVRHPLGYLKYLARKL